MVNMYKELLSVFKKNSLLENAFERSYDMIDITGKMFHEVRKRLREDKSYTYSFDIRDKDIAVNRFERQVRRDVFNHLCVSGTEDLNSGLILISIIIDIERIGDYTKNMVEISESLNGVLEGTRYDDDLNKIEQAIEDTFLRVRKSFEDGDSAKADNLLNEYFWVNKLCDQHVYDIVNDKNEDRASGKSVALALYFRYLKRINSHLRNVASSVVNPFHRIGFKKKKK